MSTILLGWELGGGFGHVRPLLAIARELASRGHTPVFALRNIADTWPALRREGFTVLQAPFRSGAPKLSPGPFHGRSFADVLSISGWSDPEELEPLVRAWDALIERLRPALAIVDHAPLLCLAARGSIPVVQTGAGFGVPPSHLDEFPVQRAGATELVPPQSLVDAIAEVQRRRNRPVPAKLPAIFDVGPAFVTGFPEFDPYREFRRDAHLGPLEAVSPPVPLPPAPRWFAYLGADQEGATDWVSDLVRTRIPGEAFVRGLTSAARDRFRKSGLPLLDAPLPVEDILARFSVIAHHSGTGIGSAALAAGRPQLLMPRWLEQQIPARNLVELGVALAPGEGESAGAALKRLVSEPGFAEAAARSAERIRSSGPWHATATVVEGCLSLLEREKPR